MSKPRRIGTGDTGTGSDGLPGTLGETFALQARNPTHSIAIQFVEPGASSLKESSIRTATFEDLASSAMAVARAISHRSRPGDRALILCEPGPDYVAALFGCFYAAVVAVPAYPLMQHGVDERVQRIADDCRPTVILTTSLLAEPCRGVELPSANGDADAIIVVDELHSDKADSEFVPASVAPTALALLQYTSGSTGEPRGVMLSHANILSNVRAIGSHLKISGDDQAVFWLPPYHDMGLMGGILTPILHGFGTTLMSPLSFLYDPLLWLEAITEYGTTISAAPNFAYELCIRKADETRAASFDLKTLRVLINGAEPVSYTTMNRFTEHFRNTGFRRSAFMPCYGLAEATLMVTGIAEDEDLTIARRQSGDRDAPSPTEPSVSLLAVSVGRTDANGQLLIVDAETRRECQEGETGEIWFQGPGVALGYWDRERQGDDAFAGRLADEPDRGVFLRTGDVGVLHDGELYVAGRLKDLIIIHGRNHYPHDIENTAVKADPRLRPGCIAAFEVQTSNGPEAVLVAESRVSVDDSTADEIWQRVRGAVNEHEGLSLAELVLVARGTIPKTTSGKIRRRPTCSAYLDGRLDVIARRRGGVVNEPAPAPAYDDRALAERMSEASFDARRAITLPIVRAHTARLLGNKSDAIDPQRTFVQLGIDSERAVQLSRALSEAINIRLAPTLAYDFPTPLAVAEHLCQRFEGRVRRPSLRERGSPSQADEPIAIVGMSCRFPGGVRSPQDLWRFLVSGGDAIGEFPQDRGWDLESLYTPDADIPDTSNPRHGGFLDDAACFDASHFGISPREALAMDPQQRLLLEGAWEAWENAGIDPLTLRGSSTGVFAGVSHFGYGMNSVQRPELEGLRLTGSTTSVVPGRVAYYFGLEGPAVSLDTACSSSLMAIHNACRSLQQDECDLALAGGVTIIATPAIFVEFARHGGLSPDGRCRAFADAASGTGFSEGMGLLVLERLDEARRRGHRVLALIIGSAANHDGASNGLTAPNGPSQERVIAQALANAGIGPDDVQTVEAHGTGTVLGDPIEAQALLSVYGQSRCNGPLRFGSIKSNIGHTQAAAGVAGVIKIVQAMSNSLLPRTLHVDAPSRHIDWSTGEIELLTDAVPWSAGYGPRRAGVSSFGISGTNVHLIVEEAPPCEPARIASEPTPGDERPCVLPLSASSPGALTDQANRLQSHLRTHPDIALSEVAATLAGGRSHLEHRAAIVCSDRAAMIAGLETVASGKTTAGVVRARARRRPKVALVFPGQGGQWENMAVALYHASPVFAQHMQACADALAPYVDFSFKDLLTGTIDLNRIDVVQPSLFAVMVSLAALWRSFGVIPSVVLGHSQGEIAAAHVAGGLSLEDAALIVGVRSKLIASIASRGTMVSIAAREERARELIEPFGKSVTVAAINGPASVVLACDHKSADKILKEHRDGPLKARVVPATVPTHSAYVEDLRDTLLGQLGSIRPQSGQIPFLSTTRCAFVDTAALDGSYWYSNLRDAVRFEDATRTLIADSHNAFIEVSPHPVLSLAIAETIQASGDDPNDAAVIASLSRDDGDLHRFLISVAQAHVSGVEVDWSAMSVGSARVELPTYAFQRERFWLDPDTHAGDARSLGQNAAEHPLLASALPLAGRAKAWMFTVRLSTRTHPWLKDHMAMGAVAFPGAGLLELALAAGERTGAHCVEELVLHAPLFLDEEQAVQVQITVDEPDEAGRSPLSIFSRSEDSSDEWTLHASGGLRDDGSDMESDEALRRFTAQEWPPAGAQKLDLGGFYQRLADVGYEYGPIFQGLRAAWRHNDELFAEVALGDDQTPEARRFCVHPVLADAAMHALALPLLGHASNDEIAVPFSFSGVRVHAQGASSLRVRLAAEPERVSLLAVDDAGQPAYEIRALTVRAIKRDQLRAAPFDPRHSLFEIEWHRLNTSPPRGLPQESVALLGDWSREGPPGIRRYGAFEAMVADIETGRAGVPGHILIDVASLSGAQDGRRSELSELVHRISQRALYLLNDFLSCDRLSPARLVFLTEGALAINAHEIPNLIQGALPGLLRSANSEHPGRVSLIDLDPDDDSLDHLESALLIGEQELAIRQKSIYAPRVKHVSPSTSLVAPVSGTVPWHLSSGQVGTLEGLELRPNPWAGEPLEPGQVRIAVHAAGLNFRDVMMALGVYPGEAALGSEAAGLVLEVGAQVTGIAVGDRVMGLVPNAFGPLAVTDHRLIAKIPSEWSFVQAATVPIAFLTAYSALIDVARLERGEALLVHGAAGGVGMAALQIAAHVGGEIFATAHPSKWQTLKELGIADQHLASSRDLAFSERFLASTEGRGVDVVLDSLTGGFVDASLRLLPRGGRFVELGKADQRHPATVASEHKGVIYTAFDLTTLRPERIHEIFEDVIGLFQQGVFEHPPASIFDVRHAPEAFRFMRESRHKGKIVLTVPQPPNPDGTVLITGGTGGLGKLFATHMVERHGAKRLLLTSRSGPHADGASELKAKLEEMGAEVEIVACDVSQRHQLQQVIAQVPKQHPLTSVIHAAGELDDCMIESLDGERLRKVMAPKVDGAINLHELTKESGLSEFVLLSSVAATFGSPGQANYAAANAFLDALAQYRHADGLPAVSLEWGAWDRTTGMSMSLSDEDRARRERWGVLSLSDGEGLELLDIARAVAKPLLLPVRLDTAALRRLARAGMLPSIFERIAPRETHRSSSPQGSLARALSKAPESERDALVLDLVRRETAAVLGNTTAETVDVERPFKDLGFDSMAAVELANRLRQTTGLTVAPTLAFHCPTISAVAQSLRMQAENNEHRSSEAPPVRHSANEPIAIVGMSCRYPGGVASPLDLWNLVAAGFDAISEFPRDRGWDLERLCDPNPDNPGASITRHGGFLDNVSDFDADFFSISASEALLMDPQQRLLLEGAWEAFEAARIDPTSLKTAKTGVFTGVMTYDYGVGSDFEARHGFSTASIGGAMAHGRIAYSLGLQGPAFSVDTACSSGLVAVHLACQALRHGECDMALAGGVTVLSRPGMFSLFSRQRRLAIDGRCKSFAATADGTGLSEGMGLLALERLSDAQSNGRRVLAVIRGSAVFHGGTSNGLTAPNGQAQETVIHEALANAGLAPDEIDAVEAQGSGTPLGDSIEAQALAATYGKEHSKERPLWIGSVKSNIGHSQAAGSIAGVIKLVQAMRNNLLPPTLHADEPTPHVDWSSGHIRLLTSAQRWPRSDRPRRAGVSTFGATGTNVHLILEEAPVAEALTREPSTAALPVVPLVVSAKTQEALRAQAGRLREYLHERADFEQSDLAFSLATTRAALEYRACVVGWDRSVLLAGLAALERGDHPVDPVFLGTAAPTGETVALFSDCPPESGAAALNLAKLFPVFAKRLDEVCAAFEGHLDRSLWVLLSAPADSVDAALLKQTPFAQSASFALQVATYRLIESLGIQPDCLVGYSLGQLAAGHVAGAISLEDAVMLLLAQTRLVGGTSVSETGSLTDLQTITSRLRFSEPALPILSCLTGAQLSPEQATSPAHWTRLIGETSDFADVMRTLARSGFSCYLHLGPDNARSTTVKFLSEDTEPGLLVAHAFDSRRGAADALIHFLAQAFTHGLKVDWRALLAGRGARTVELPTYAFQGKRYWPDADGTLTTVAEIPDAPQSPTPRPEKEIDVRTDTHTSADTLV